MVETRSGKMQDPAQERIMPEESAKPQPGATIGGDASSDPVVLNPNIDIPKYDGTEDPRPWIESLEEIGFLYHWADYIISRYAAMNMIGSAKTWLNLHKISFTSWENFKSRLIQDFASDANKEEMKMRLNRMQQWNEPAIRFAEDILVLCNKVDPQMEEETKINWVIGGLKKEYSFALHLNPPKNTNELLEICKKLDLFEKNYQERAEKSKALYNGPRSPRPHHQEQWKNATSFRRPYQNTSKPQAPAPRYSQNTSKPQAPTPRYYQNKPLPQVSAPRRSYTPNPEPKPVYPSKTYNKNPNSNRNRTEDGRPICFKCNKPGHVARYCRVRFVRIVEEDPIVTQDKVEEEIRMDNGTQKSRPLLYADNLKDPTGRLARWALKIQEYNFEIIHKSGKKHLDADGLSRGPLPENEWDEDYERLFLNQIIDEKDYFIENIKENLSGNKRSITQNFKEENGCLYKKNPNPEAFSTSLFPSSGAGVSYVHPTFWLLCDRLAPALETLWSCRSPHSPNVVCSGGRRLLVQLLPTSCGLELERDLPCWNIVETLVLRGTTTPFLFVSTHTTRRMLERPCLASIAHHPAREEVDYTSESPQHLSWSSLCAFSGHARFSTSSPSSLGPTVLRRLPLFREAFTIIPPDLQGWVFGHGLDDDVLTILANGNCHLYNVTSYPDAIRVFRLLRMPQRYT
ncbi:hypothetical protein LAZ67_5001333 [Cordylochernes scorpioides]|uniref:CCHC-type domain-containing protein n=1 Tax=Cordylochernes scorpioides TaxID=51811 RepID=A0ABY6KGA1_9ARAC|nr:hypothetical protein LAZ67_5001333 [Cordylochernes scorpioides]